MCVGAGGGFSPYASLGTFSFFLAFSVCLSRFLLMLFLSGRLTLSDMVFLPPLIQ